jgi:hypothetical protein
MGIGYGLDDGVNDLVTRKAEAYAVNRKHYYFGLHYACKLMGE